MSEKQQENIIEIKDLVKKYKMYHVYKCTLIQNVAKTALKDKKILHFIKYIIVTYENICYTASGV